MIEVRLVVETPENWVKEMNQAHSALVKIMDTKRYKSAKSTQDFVEISSSTVSSEDLVKSLRTSDSIESIDLVRLGPHKVMGTITTSRCPVCSTLSGLNCSLLSASTIADSKMEWKLLMSGDDTLRKVTDRLESQHVDFKILEVTRIRDSKELTARQEQIIKIALELGYFEFPKKIRMEELATRLGITPGTLSEILRRAEKNILTRYFRGH